MNLMCSVFDRVKPFSHSPPKPPRYKLRGILLNKPCDHSVERTKAACHISVIWVPSIALKLSVSNSW